MRDFLKNIKAIGRLKIDEISFPLNYIISDNTATIFENDLNLSENQIRDLEDSISSIKVSALKTPIKF